MKDAADTLASANQDYLDAVNVRDKYDTYSAAYLKDLETFETNRKEIAGMAQEMNTLRSTGKMYESDGKTLTDAYKKAYDAYEAAFKVSGLSGDTKPAWYLTKYTENETVGSDYIATSADEGDSVATYRADRAEIWAIERKVNNSGNVSTPAASATYDANAVSNAKDAINSVKEVLKTNVQTADTARQNASDALDKLNATSANLTNLKTAWDNAAKDEADKLTAKNNAVAAAVEASKKVTAAQNKYDTAFKEQQAVKNLDDTDVAELQRFGKYNAYAILGVKDPTSTTDASVTNQPVSDPNVELTVLENTLRSAQDYVAATQKAKDAKDAAADEMHKASNILTRKKAAWRLGTPSIKVTSKKGAVKVSWKKVKHASKYKLRVKKGNGSYKTYYTSKTSKTFKVKKGTKVKVKVRAQKGTKVSHYSGYKAARAK
jgi:hypothetical protein